MKTNGPGKYDAACTVAREITDASAVILIVFEGNQGNGFSIQTKDSLLIEALPGILEAMAQQIREDLKATMQ
jgi:hypothetical protein